MNMMQSNHKQASLIKKAIKLLGLFQRSSRGQYTNKGLKSRKAMGLVYNHIPYGYKRVGNSLVQDKQETQVIVEIKRKHKNGLSYRAVARYLNENAIPTKLGKQWHANTVKRMVLRKRIGEC